MAEITFNGYVVKNANEWFEEEQARYLAIDPNWNLDPSTPDGLKTATDSEIWASLDEIGLKAYNSKDPNKAEGSELDVLLYLTTGSVRNDGSPSSVGLIISGIDGTVIPEGSRVSSPENNQQWQTLSEVTISGGSVNVDANSVNNGAIEASIGSITSIDDPISGWQSVTNPAIAILGKNPETDSEVRARRNSSVSKVGQNQVDTMASELLSLEDVTDVQIYENDTDSDAVDPVNNPFGLPKNSITPIIDGGDDNEIANAIYNEKNPGCALNAANTPIEIEVTSPVTGNVKVITFSRPVFVDIVIGVSVVDGGTLPPNIEDLIAQAIVDYANGNLLSSGIGFNDTGFKIGDDVSAGQIYTPVNQVVGQYDGSYATGIFVNGGNIATIEFNEKSSFSTDDITVTVS